MIKFLAHGTGSAAKAADYLTRERFPRLLPVSKSEDTCEGCPLAVRCYWMI